MSALEDLKPEELQALSDSDFQAHVRRHARSKTADALNVIESVMHESDDDQARLIAASKYLKIAKAEEEEQAHVPLNSVSEEVLAKALVGLGQLAAIAASTRVTAIPIGFTPAPADPRIAHDNSPFNLPAPKAVARQGDANDLSDYEVPGADVIEENVDVEE
jgi:hypothetical protein